MDKHVNFYFQSLLSTIIYVFDILFILPESRKIRKILPGFSTSLCLGWPPSSHHVLLTYSPCLKGPCCRSYRTTQYTTTGDDGQGTVWNQGVRRSDVCSCIGALGGSIGPIVTVSQHSPLSRGSGLGDCSLFLTWHQDLNSNKTTTSGLGRLGFYMDHRVTGSCWRDSWV